MEDPYPPGRNHVSLIRFSPILFPSTLQYLLLPKVYSLRKDKTVSYSVILSRSHGPVPLSNGDPPYPPTSSTVRWITIDVY